MNTIAVATATDADNTGENKRQPRASLRAFRKAGTWLRTSLIGSARASAGRGVSDFAGSYRNSDLEDEEQNHVFDSPLQTSVHLLLELQSKLNRMHMRGDSRTVEQVLGLLKSPDLLNSKPMDELIADGKIKADDSIKNWLEAMEWVRKEKSRSSADLVSQRGSTNRASSRLSRMNSDMLADVEASTSSRFGALDEAADTTSARRLIMPRIAKGLSSAAESRIIEMLEHEITGWEFDMFELETLTGGHPVQAFVRAHCPSAHCPLVPARLLTFSLTDVHRRVLVCVDRGGPSASATGCAAR